MNIILKALKPFSLCTSIFLPLTLLPPISATDAASARLAIQSMEFQHIPAGTFQMGADLDPSYITNERGIFIQDELPSRRVTLGYDFAMATTEVTNQAFELYKAEQHELRGKAHGISEGNQEAVVFVNWFDAMDYCAWLSFHDPVYDYRLPTEAEWEYAFRAGTTTPYYDGKTGDIYEMNPFAENGNPQNVLTEWAVTTSNRTTNGLAWTKISDVDLTVGQGEPNPWGLHDLMGNVQEWCLDWYGPYDASDTTNPVGYIHGESKVVRGGAHHNYIQTFRSANRISSNRSTAHAMLGFRVVRVPKGQTLPQPHLELEPPVWRKNVSPSPFAWTKDSADPTFEITSIYDIESDYDSPQKAAEFLIPLYTHNHSPAITWTENGDLLMNWFSGDSEKGQELTVLGARGRRLPDGSVQWDREISEFYKEADRNVHGAHLWNNAVRLENGFDEPFTLYHLNGVSTDGRWSRLAMVFRTSIDNGATWTEPSVVKQAFDAFHLDNNRNIPQGNSFTMNDGTLISNSDGGIEGWTGASINVSNNGGRTWKVQTLQNGPPGIHVAGVELNNGNLLLFSRDKGEMFGTMPRSISPDKGASFEISASPFPGITNVQRSALLRLRYSDPSLDPEGLDRLPILHVSFADDGIAGLDANGEPATIFGSFAALSWDEGETWPLVRVLSDVRSGEEIWHAAPWNERIVLDATHGQPKSYWDATQTPDGLVYLSDGRLVYSFNLAWILNQ